MGNKQKQKQSKQPSWLGRMPPKTILAVILVSSIAYCGLLTPTSEEEIVEWQCDSVCEADVQEMLRLYPNMTRAELLATLQILAEDDGNY